MIYLDNNATTPLLPEVSRAIHDALGVGASNPSSPHQAGDAARQLILDAREAVAELVGASPTDVYFTSSGTESNNWVLHALTRRDGAEVVTTPIEHESIRQKAEMLKAEGVRVHELPVDGRGTVLLDRADDLISTDTSLVSVQWVNNETGVVQPIQQIAQICRARGVPFHTDGAQAVGKMPIDLSTQMADYVTFTGHKFHAPKGIGVLWRRPGTPLLPMLGGGTQEHGLRPGTENLLGIVGIGQAASIRKQRLSDVLALLSELRDRFESAVLQACDGAVINGGSAPRVCNTTNVQFCGVDGEALMAQLNNHNVYCSHSSACTSQLPEPSHVLTAMGLSTEEAFSSIRFSFSELNTADEVDQAVEVIAGTYAKLKAVIGAGVASSSDRK